MNLRNQKGGNHAAVKINKIAMRMKRRQTFLVKMIFSTSSFSFVTNYMIWGRLQACRCSQLKLNNTRHSCFYLMTYHNADIDWYCFVKHTIYSFTYLYFTRLESTMSSKREELSLTWYLWFGTSPWKEIFYILELKPWTHLWLAPWWVRNIIKILSSKFNRNWTSVTLSRRPHPLCIVELESKMTYGLGF